VPNVRDEQVFRQTILTANAKARDEQVFRQTILSTNAKVRDFQVFRQSIVLLGTTPSLYTMVYAAT
jgi:hypothetical protein